MAHCAALPPLISASLITAVWPQLNLHSCKVLHSWQDSFASITSFDLQTSLRERPDRDPYNPHCIIRETRLRSVTFSSGHIAGKWPSHKIMLLSTSYVITSIPRQRRGSELGYERGLEVGSQNIDPGAWANSISHSDPSLSVLLILPASCGASTGPGVSDPSQEW